MEIKKETFTALLKSHFKNEPERFNAISLQIAAHVADRQKELAEEIRTIVNSRQSIIAPLPVEVQNMLLEIPVNGFTIDSLITTKNIKKEIIDILDENKQAEKLANAGLIPDRKILLTGCPGVGKTFTSRIIANELNMPLFAIQTHSIISSFLGETSTKLSKVFKFMQSQKAVYLFDEFDSIGAQRTNGHTEMAEMRRVLNSFLQFIENESSENIIIAATNMNTLLDKALFRRFDKILSYPLPTINEIEQLFKQLNINFVYYTKNEILFRCKGLSHDEIIKTLLKLKKKEVLDGILPTVDFLRNEINNKKIIKRLKKGD